MRKKLIYIYPCTPEILILISGFGFRFGFRFQVLLVTSLLVCTFASALKCTFEWCQFAFALRTSFRLAAAFYKFSCFLAWLILWHPFWYPGPAFECFLPKAWGDGRFWWDCKHLLQTPHWKIARKVCRNSASSVGGIVSMFLFCWKYRRMRASLTFVKIDVLWYIKIVNLWMLWNLASSWVKLWKGLLKKKAKVDSAFGHTFRASYSGVRGKTA